MAANINPIYTKVGAITVWTTTLATVSVADYTWVGAHNQLIFTADATNWSYIKSLRFKALWTNVGAVARIYINNGSTNWTATNNQFFWEISLPATTASTTSSTLDIDYPLWIALPPWYKIYVWLGATVAAWWVVCAIAWTY